MSRLRALVAALDSPAGVFAAGWALVVGGLAMRSWSVALVAGGGILLVVVLIGAVRRT